jgi:hypothetical protein
MRGSISLYLLLLLTFSEEIVSFFTVYAFDPYSTFRKNSLAEKFGSILLREK